MERKHRREERGVRGDAVPSWKADLFAAKQPKTSAAPPPPPAPAVSKPAPGALAEAAHPSWIAAQQKKAKETAQPAFQGKKITFGDDD